MPWGDPDGGNPYATTRPRSGTLPRTVCWHHPAPGRKLLDEAAGAGQEVTRWDPIPGAISYK